MLRNAIGPVWDGNEVWLLTAGGALFAAFPTVYATVFSGFYLALMLVLFGLIVRAVSLEFRHWRRRAGPRVWDLGFFVGQPAAGAALRRRRRQHRARRPRSTAGGPDYAGTFLDLLNPSRCSCGVLGLSMFVMQGAAWPRVKSEGALHERARQGALVVAGRLRRSRGRDDGGDLVRGRGPRHQHPRPLLRLGRDRRPRRRSRQSPVSR